MIGLSLPWRLTSALLLAPAAVHAQAATAPVMQADTARSVRAEPLGDVRIAVDGRLDEAVWRRGVSADDFVQYGPEPGRPATLGTEVRVVYAPDALYLGLRMRDPHPDSIAAPLGRRDAAPANSDWVHVSIDSYHDLRTAFRFSVNPRGLKRDALLFEDIRRDDGWDAVWEAEARVDSAGWTAEMRIPLSQLRFGRTGEGEARVWGINFIREVARRDEKSYWAAVLPTSGREVSLSGELVGLDGLRPANRLELMPYVAARVTRTPGTDANPFYRRNDPFGAIGADVKYGFRSGMTLTGTVNPDFGQVDADPAQVNLTALETFLPERRPFFTEGANLFRLPLGLTASGNEGLFYSRRIGRAPQRKVSETGGWVEGMEATSIVEAGKLSGKLPGGWSVGVLQALTADEAVSVADSTGAVRVEPVEPRTHFLVARASRDFGAGNSVLGGMVTAVNRDLSDPRLSFLRSSAYAAGLDVRHRFRRDYVVRGWLVGSRVSGTPAAMTALQRGSVHYFQRPDADHVQLDSARTSLAGWSGYMALSRVSGGSWTWDLIALARSPGFEVNDAGYQPRADFVSTVAGARYTQSSPAGIFRRWGAGLSPYSTWSFGGETTQLGLTANADFQLRNLWSGVVVVDRQMAALSTTELRGGPAVLLPGRTQATVQLSTDPRRLLAVTGTGTVGRRDGGGTASELSASLAYRPSARMELVAGPRVAWNRDPLQYVQTVSAAGAPHYLYGAIDQTTVSLTTRVNYTFTPTLSLQLYGQPFVSAGRFAGFREARDPRAGRLDARFPRFGEEQLALESGRYALDLDGDGGTDLRFANPDFNVMQFRSNLVLRWEYRPGSTLYVGWSQGRDEALADGSFQLGRDFDRLATVRPTNSLMIKLSYWLNP
jgi:hypothetical protein